MDGWQRQHTGGQEEQEESIVFLLKTGGAVAHLPLLPRVQQRNQNAPVPVLLLLRRREASDRSPSVESANYDEQ
jgi:hypothetical protein